MLFRFRFAVVVLSVSSMLIAGCKAPSSTKPASTAPVSDAPKVESGSDPAAEKRAQAHAHYAAGVIHDMDDEPEAALEEYYQAALLDTGNERLVLEVSDRLIRHKQFEKAQQLLSRRAALPGASGAVYARLGMVYAQLGKTEQAISADRLAIKRGPNQLGGYQNLFLSYLQAHRQNDAVAVLDSAARQDGTDAEFLIGLGELYNSYLQQAPTQREKLKPKALAVLERARKLNVSNPLLQLRLADGFNALGEQETAADIYLALLKTLPDVPFVRERLQAKLAEIYLRSKHPERANAQLQAIVKAEPTNPMAHYYLGYLAYQAKDSAKAEDEFGKAVLLSPDFEDAYYELALAQLSQNRVTNALATLGRARAKFKDNFVLEFYSGLAYTREKNYQDALRCFTGAEVIAKATDPNRLDQDLYFQLGACSERLGDFAQAEKYFQKCLDLAPDFAEAQNYLGYMLAEHGLKLDTARALIEKAVKAEPKNPAYLDSLGWVLFKLNQPQAALEQVRKAVELSTDPDPTLYDHLGDIYAALKQMPQAREAWEKSLSLEPNDTVRKKLESQP